MWKIKSINIHNRWLKIIENRTKKKKSKDEVVNFLTIALCGEVGEFANLIKKINRGDDINIQDVHSELADIRIYLEHLSRYMLCNLDKACSIKIKEVEKRLDILEDTKGNS